ncbi:MAG: VOC family protein [Halobacteriota archaeon]
MPQGRVMYFELPADDPQRAIAFYEKVFDSTSSMSKWQTETATAGWTLTSSSSRF